MGLTADVMDVVLLEFHLEPGFTPPRSVLPPVVGQHLLGHTVFGHGATVDFQDVLAGLAAEQIQPNQIARVVIHEADQVRLLAAEPDGADIALPELHRRRPLEEPRFRRIPPALGFGLGQQLMLVQRLAHRLRAGRQQQHPAHPLGNAPDAALRILRLQPHDFLLHGDGARTRQDGLVPPLWLQTGLAILPVTPDPAPDGVGRQMQFLRDQAHDEAFFQV